MASQGGGAGGSQSSPGSASKYANRQNTLRPVTIKQILEATSNGSGGTTDTDLRIDDHELTHVTFVGQIRSISEQTSVLVYRIDDGTGAIEAKQWIDPDSPTAHLTRERCVENAYVRVLGQPKAFGGKRVVSAHSVRPVREYNEVLFHFLEATVIHLRLTRGWIEQGGGGGVGAASGGDVSMGGMGGWGQGMGMGGRAGQQMVGAGGGGNTGPEGLSPSARKVYQYLGTVAGGDGVHINFIAKNTGLRLQEVQKARDELVSGGCAYSTVDDDTLMLCI